jgi:hypothetical protein
MLIKITQNDIDLGIPGNSCKCPIALSMRRIFPGEDIEVSRSFIYLGKSTAYYIPEAARNFIKAFDKRLPVAPCEFELKL